MKNNFIAYGQAIAAAEPALAYAMELNLPIFPCHNTPDDPDKQKAPLTPNGFYDATRDPVQLMQWWQENPDALIGMPTGPVSGIDVLDLDVKNGKNGFAAVPDWKKRSPVIARTTNDGAHLYFKSDGSLRSTQNKNGVDIKARGGYVIVPPSQGYRWFNGSDLSNLPPWPADLRPAASAGKRPPGFSSNYPPLDDWEVDAALKATPSDDYFVWFENGCALAKKYGNDGFARWDAWSATSSKYDQRACTRKWNECQKVIGYNDNTLIYYANEADPDWSQQAKPVDPIILQPHDFPDEKTIPQWDFLYGRHLLRRTVGGTAATGSTGKTSLSLVEAMEMAAGKSLLGEDVPHPLRVLLICLEDNREAMNKRIAAAMKRYGLTPKDLGGRLFVKAKGEISFKIVIQDKSGIRPDKKFIAELIKQLTANKIDVLSVDPFLKTHGVNENDNMAIGSVIEAYDEIAERADCAVSLWHHTRKGNAMGATIDSARGASSFIDACRSVRIAETMTKEEAAKLKIDNYKTYFRIFSGKLNFAPASDKSTWYHIASVPILNGPLQHCTVDGGNGGDSVGVVEAWQLPSTGDVELTAEQIAAITQAVKQSEWRENAQAGMWVGKAIAQVVGLDAEDNKPKLKQLIKKLISDQILKLIPGQKSDRKACLLVVAGDHVAAPCEVPQKKKGKK